MHLLYVDESGKSGLRDPVQPFYVLGGLAIHDSDWHTVERALIAAVDSLVPPPRPPEWEIHMVQIMYGKGHFKGISRHDRDQLVRCVTDILAGHPLTLFMMVIDKQALCARYLYPDPPEATAYKFMMERFDWYLHRQTDKIGIIVSDDQKGQERTIRDAHEMYRRNGTNAMSIDYIAETPFFVPSHHSWMIQLVDGATYWCNRAMKAAANGRPEPPEWTSLKTALDRTRGDTVGFKVFP